ncbi:MAG TPA: hypothetical protein VGV39_22955 [Mesorhizobium sp.]|jgi:hypothetical protein|uniref:hypothetical protein n=1 Tax=Mesorhizobium sp. TaxID=1871066 RepID=UPI002DDD623A|nr:hypothetical protein [Mesorhizobium sp.]HEV2505955.1 hypothetical protein [Mesorhizobium sp.]
MSAPHHFTSGIAYPDDLTLLREIYDDICLQRGFHCGSCAAEDLARATMNLFGQGVIEETEIRESLDIYLGRKSPASELLAL